MADLDLTQLVQKQRAGSTCSAQCSWCTSFSEDAIASGRPCRQSSGWTEGFAEQRRQGRAGIPGPVCGEVERPRPGVGKVFQGRLLVQAAKPMLVTYSYWPHSEPRSTTASLIQASSRASSSSLAHASTMRFQ